MLQHFSFFFRPLVHTPKKITMIFGMFFERLGSACHLQTVVQILWPFTASAVLFVNILIGEWITPHHNNCSPNYTSEGCYFSVQLTKFSQSLKFFVSITVRSSSYSPRALHQISVLIFF